MVEGKEDKSEVSDLAGTKKAHICIGDQLPRYADRKLHAGELYYYPDFNPFDGSIEVKEVNGTRYIYAIKREASRNTSTYLGVYSDERYDALIRQAQELRTLKKELRAIEKKLAALGYTNEDLDPRVLLNIDYARANVKSLIYDQAVLEGISTTFPQTDAILENGIVNGVRAQDVQKILNLKHAWEFVLDKDVLRSDTDFYIRRPERHNTVYERKMLETVLG